VSLALTGTGAGTVATVPALAAVAVGDESVTFPISILSNPGVQAAPNSFQITATLVSAVSTTSSQSADFTVTGVQPPVILQ
jgi:hypothetical protein